MTEPNYAGNIIISLASLPDFLRKPILKKRMMEFFSMSDPEKNEVIKNALDAGPTIPFPNFSKLFKTWLEVLTTFAEEQRKNLFSFYILEVSNSPQKLINYNLDGIFGIFLTLDDKKKHILSQTIRDIFSELEQTKRKRIQMIIPDQARKLIGI